MSRRHSQSKPRRSHRLAGLGEPITIAAIPWLWVAGGALFAKLLHGMSGADTLTPESIQRAQEMRSYLADRIKSQGTLWVGGIAIDDFIAANPDLLDGSKYASGKAPTKAELANELVAVASIMGRVAFPGTAYGERAGDITSRFTAGSTLQGVGAARDLLAARRLAAYSDAEVYPDFDQVHARLPSTLSGSGRYY